MIQQLWKSETLNLYMFFDFNIKKQKQNDTTCTVQVFLSVTTPLYYHKQSKWVAYVALFSLQTTFADLNVNIMDVLVFIPDVRYLTSNTEAGVNQSKSISIVTKPSSL